MKIEKYLNEETKHEDFVSRIDFINRTMVFCTPEYYEMIYDDFVESGVSPAEFVRNYRNKYATCLLEVSIGDDTIYYELDDDILGAIDYPEDEFDFNILELLNNIAMAHSHKNKYAEEMITSYQKVVESQMQINTELIDIVNDCTARSKEVAEAIEVICDTSGETYKLRGLDGETGSVHNPDISLEDLPLRYN